MTDTLGVKWFHPQITSEYQQTESKENIDAYSFFFQPTGVELTIDVSCPQSLRIHPGNTSPDDDTTIIFSNITRVFYFKYSPIFVAESIIEEAFSELEILKTGEFYININIPIQEYSTSFANLHQKKESTYKQPFVPRK